ncbi:hypothetical protein LSUE1_G004808 [Lachnellula suecica]|uniref:Uncharacterized protein n=1 Tax=Lachnellula suecica TaxID=602035 RepID=A0A8T9C466_9HELO|nr:hypothetical protein LSUE1_G004808 [Lachnellula suecica]
MALQSFRRLFRRFTKSLPPLSTPSLTQDDRNSSSPLPPPPREILARRDEHEDIIYTRARPDEKLDTPLAALYRMYEYIILDQHIKLRNELESYWYHSSWAIKEIPDPHDADAERYAVLACITALLVLSFNDRINLGLPRDAPPILTGDLLDEYKTRTKIPEEAPSWASEVPALENTLKIPHWDREKHDFLPLESFSSIGTSPDFQSKNILIWQPHIYFT